MGEPRTPPAARRTPSFQLVHRRKACFDPAISRTLRHLKDHFKGMNHRDGPLACEHFLRLAEDRLLKG